MTGPWVIIGCGKAKQAAPAPAGDLYTSAYIRCAVRWARSVTSPDRILILSAKHGLIRSTQTIEPYDVSFTHPAPSRERPVTLAQLAAQITELGLQGRVITLAGVEYRRRLLAASRGEVRPFNPFRPVLNRLGLNAQRGYQAQQFNRWHGCIPTATQLTPTTERQPREKPEPPPS